MGISKTETIYVELDALLDTRLATIARLDKSVAESIVENGYHSRNADWFDGIDMNEFQRLYKERNADILPYALLTNMMGVLNQLIKDLLKQAIARPYFDGVKLEVNTFPYRLTDEEESLLGRAVASYMPAGITVELVYLTLEDLTPAYCKDRYAVMVMYEYDPWMSLHAEKWASTILTDIIVFSPRIYYGKPPSAEDLKSVPKHVPDPLTSMEHTASAIVGLSLIDVMYFSVLTTPEKLTA